MKCPVDLNVSNIEGVKVLTYPECGGILLHHEEIKKIAHPTIGDVDYFSTENMDENRHFKLSYPSCATKGMLDINFVSYSDISMEYCNESKAIWLEKDTLE